MSTTRINMNNNELTNVRWEIARMSVAVFLLILSEVAAKTVDEVHSDMNPTKAPFSETVTCGLLFLNGEFISAPYRIEVTGEHESVMLNDVVISSNALTMTERRSGAVRRFGGKGRGGNQTWRGGSTLARRRGGLSTTFSAVRKILSTLQHEGIIILFENQPMRRFLLGSEIFDFCMALLADDPTEEQIERFLTLWESADGQQWRDWLLHFSPDLELRRLMQARIDKIEEEEASNERRTAATARLETLAFPLTLCGMLLGVIAFGHMMKWMSRGISSDADTPESQRHVVTALWLMMGMSIIDLVWTILAGQAGIIEELNPVAARFINSPVQLTFFKLVVTSAGLGVLFVWRHRHQIQQAAWWMCLVCVLLTFRWVIFDSLMS